MIAEKTVRELRLFDDVAMVLEFSRDQDGMPGVRVLDVPGRGAPLPPGLVPTDEGLERWLSSRALPQNRRFADRLCMMLGLRPDDVQQLLSASYGLSLNDSYWVVPEGFDGAWADLNLYENGFSAALAAIAYAGGLDLGSSPLRGLTPELTTGGTLRKAWRIGADGRRLLYKGSSPGFEPGEWLSECLAWQVAHAMGIPCVEYTYDSWEGTDCSVCACFCTAQVSYVPFAVATGAKGFTKALALLDGMDLLEDFADMWTLDCLVCNTDRHMTNFGLLYDARTGARLGMAPVFDNGRALFPNVGEFSAADGPLLANVTFPALGSSTFDEGAARLIGARQAERLGRLADFEFDLSGLPAWTHSRARELAAFIRVRARDLAALPLVDRTELAEALAQFA